MVFWRPLSSSLLQASTRASARPRCSASAVFLSMMEAVAAVATPPLALSAAASSSCCCFSFASRDLGLAHAAPWRGLESSSSLYLLPAGGSKLQGRKFVENSQRGRSAAWSLRVRCDAGVAVVKERVGEDEWRRLKFTTVMKFGGSSVASAHRMREVADLILSFKEERPIVVLSAMGKTTNNLLKVCMMLVRCPGRED